MPDWNDRGDDDGNKGSDDDWNGGGEDGWNETDDTHGGWGNSRRDSSEEDVVDAELSGKTDTSATGPEGMAPEKGPDSRQLGKTLGVSVGLGLGGLALGVIASIPLMFGVIALFGLPFQATAEGQNLPGFVTNTIALQGVGMVGISVWYLSRHNLGLEFLRLRKLTLRHVGWIIAGAIILFIVNIISGIVIDVLGLPTPSHGLIDTFVETPELLLAGIVLNLLLIGPAEELLYRGIIQTKLVNVGGTVKGVFLASVLFAVVHLPAYGLDGWAAIISLVFLGGVLGAIYEYTDNLLIPMIAHGVYNSLLFIMIYIAIITGNADQIVTILPI
ncbi:CPBP family intramembrane glutamic endopeptidase [Natranaeroarchaeum aerophilus]|uniref:CPBP family intramembrane metalloprotease n=1 Tax=Natranaeroarchaeum aerophilus TaxID=2917711 RepID=A0AAE3FQ15_9EURY|nr:type II CAAX endopeptidase family protein [Natranaeroarchaeum aerophilus]MCL9813046.1 CPBP family intramembrane metalloprotease [Natranaeroarchaeum aerophilus]